MSNSFEPLPSIYRSKQEFLASLPPWRRLLQKLNWRPVVDLRVQRYAIEQRLLQMRKEDERLRKLDERLAALDAGSMRLSPTPSPTRTQRHPHPTSPRHDRPAGGIRRHRLRGSEGSTLPLPDHAADPLKVIEQRGMINQMQQLQIDPPGQQQIIEFTAEFQ